MNISVKLSNAQAASSYVIIEIRGHLRVRQNLAKLGILPGVRVTVEKEAGFKGGLLLNINGQKIGIAKSVAKKIIVKPCYK